ncbi:hypothetical protein KBZ10_11565 [Streptomyces sp. F63]|uniref:hypothetical protein n=1 Tax=Streptomyces sp. F63 TaxID=2824887 RepID=UPI001B38E8F2|nr:hypothetical protein [Streptomyces sp. F63]MBQ0985147.1 hypothetical protein [Streptomyces sp. F63]
MSRRIPRAARQEEQRADTLAGVSARLGQEHETRPTYQAMARDGYAEAARRTPRAAGGAPVTALRRSVRRAFLAAHHVMAEPAVLLVALVGGFVLLLARRWEPAAVVLAVAAAGWVGGSRPVLGAPDGCPLCARAYRIEEAPDD